MIQRSVKHMTSMERQAYNSKFLQTREYNKGTVIGTPKISLCIPHKFIFLSKYRKFGVHNENFGVPITILYKDHLNILSLKNNPFKILCHFVISWKELLCISKHFLQLVFVILSCA